MFIFDKKKYFQIFVFALSLFYVPFAGAFPQTKADLELVVESIVATGLGAAEFPALNNQRFIEVGAASMSLDDDDIVFIIPIGPEKPLKERDVLIIPQKIMVWHEVMNIIRKDKAFAVTYSPVSGSLAVYNTRKKEYFLQLQYNGSQYNANSVLIDNNTNSLWSQMYGLSFFGTLQGVGLEILPCYWTTWDKARVFFTRQKNAKVLSTPRGGQRYGKDPYGSFLDKESFYHNDSLIYPVSKVDTRLGLKSQIIGIEMDNKFMAIEIEYIKKKKSVNFFFGEHPLVAIYDDRLGVVRVFKRSVWDGKDPLIFKIVDKKLLDFHTKSTWSMDGVCLSGNYLGAYVQEIFGIYSFWYSWAAHNPETEIVPGNSVVPDSALEIGVPKDNQLGKGLDGPVEHSGMGLPWE